MNYVIVRANNSIVFGPVAFNKEKFQNKLGALGDLVSLNNPNYQGPTYKILPFIDKTPDYVMEYQGLINIKYTKEKDAIVKTADVSDRYTLEAFKAKRNSQVRLEYKRSMDAMASNYALSDIAKWLELQKEIEEFRLNGKVGEKTAKIVEKGKYTVDTFADFIEGRIDMQDQYADIKAKHLKKISEYITLLEVAKHNAYTDWRTVITT